MKLTQCEALGLINSNKKLHLKLAIATIENNELKAKSYAAVNIQRTVNNFLCWRLPSDFNPDGGISFETRYLPSSPHWAIGTNLFNAKQAKDLFEQCLDYDNDFNLDYTCKRIRRLLNAMDIEDPSNGKDDVLMGCLFSLLGTVCNKIEKYNLQEKPQSKSVLKRVVTQIEPLPQNKMEKFIYLASSIGFISGLLLGYMIWGMVWF